MSPHSVAISARCLPPVRASARAYARPFVMCGEIGTGAKALARTHNDKRAFAFGNAVDHRPALCHDLPVEAIENLRPVEPQKIATADFFVSDHFRRTTLFMSH